MMDTDTPKFRADMSIEEARSILSRLVHEGHKCPVCTQMAKVYRHKCDSAMTRTLLTMYKHNGANEFLHTPSLPGDNHKVSQCAWWGLVEEEKVRRPDGGRGGWWKLTAKGLAFVMRQTTITEYVHIYDARVLSHSGDPVGVDQCLGKRFNYDELMNAVGQGAAL